MALYDQATTLMSQGKHIEARQLLQQPVQGQYADQIKVGLLSLLGDSYYRTQEFQKARQYNQEAVAGYASLTNPLQGEGLQALVATSKERLEWTQRWEKSPLFGMPKEVRFEANVSPQVPQQISIYSFAEMPFTVVSDNPNILVTQTEKGRQEAFAFAKSVTLNFLVKKSAPPLRKSFTSSLTIRSPKFPKFLLRVPVYVTVADANTTPDKLPAPQK